MYVTGPRNSAAALDARTGRAIWQYTRPLALRHPCELHRDDQPRLRDFRQQSVYGDSGLAFGRPRFEDRESTLGRGCRRLQNRHVHHACAARNRWQNHCRITAGECALTGFVDAYDAATGKRLWRINVVADKGDPARSTWAGDSANFGGGPTWMTGPTMPRPTRCSGHRESVARLRWLCARRR